ncbi:16S rRNA (guanine(527)-N(7))-methyltransferase RsmG [Zooshikella sp. RANM57]|uniref:16S rRNA (guanine(527)-N(7))-methyltransferase RsmG n=1 Tax=Zooshikella sp. RANM57 TaxID=3425863 RepID=UPI003D6FE3C3
MSMVESQRLLLVNGIKQMGLTLATDQIDALMTYLGLLVKWNQAYNLTAIRDPNTMVKRHLLDSLSVTPYIDKDHILDVGTGPGLPGIPLALFFPEKQFTLLDSNGKKTRFLTQAKIQLELDNVIVVQSRAEEFEVEQTFDIIVSRAFASLCDMLQNTHHLCADEGCFLAMKGLYPEAEIAQLDSKMAEQIEAYQLSVPGCDAQRHLIKISNKPI